MGVPSFYRWLVERYPRTVERLDGPCGAGGEYSHAGAGPIDNLYLDLNGIIHPCFHPEDRPAPETEEEVLIAILDYIDALVELVQPRTAPRARASRAAPSIPKPAVRSTST